MAPDQQGLRRLTLIAGPLVLVSYVIGIARADDADLLWGGVTGGLRAATVPFMLLAAAGFIAFGWMLLYKLNEQQIADLRWPWIASDGIGGRRAMLALGLFLIPSIFWLEATLLHINSPQAWTPSLVIGVLALVALGNLMMILLGYTAWKDGAPGGLWMFLGAVGLGLQCIVNDLIVWTSNFPW